MKRKKKVYAALVQEENPDVVRVLDTWCRCKCASFRGSANALLYPREALKIQRLETVQSVKGRRKSGSELSDGNESLDDAPREEEELKANIGSDRSQMLAERSGIGVYGVQMDRANNALRQKQPGRTVRRHTQHEPRGKGF